MTPKQIKEQEAEDAAARQTAEFVALDGFTERPTPRERRFWREAGTGKQLLSPEQEAEVNRVHA